MSKEPFQNISTGKEKPRHSRKWSERTSCPSRSGPVKCVSSETLQVWILLQIVQNAQWYDTKTSSSCYTLKCFSNKQSCDVSKHTVGRKRFILSAIWTDVCPSLPTQMENKATKRQTNKSNDWLWNDVARVTVDRAYEPCSKRAFKLKPWAERATSLTFTTGCFVSVVSLVVEPVIKEDKRRGLEADKSEVKSKRCSSNLQRQDLFYRYHIKSVSIPTLTCNQPGVLNKVFAVSQCRSLNSSVHCTRRNWTHGANLLLWRHASVWYHSLTLLIFLTQKQSSSARWRFVKLFAPTQVTHKANQRTHVWNKVFTLNLRSVKQIPSCR